MFTFANRILSELIINKHIVFGHFHKYQTLIFHLME